MKEHNCDPFESHEYRTGIYTLTEKRKAVFVEYMIAKRELEELAEELKSVDDEIITFNASHVLCPERDSETGAMTEL